MSKAAIYPTHNRWVYSESELNEIYAKKQKEYQRIINSFSVHSILDLQKNLPQQSANGQGLSQSSKNSLPGNSDSQVSQIHGEGLNQGSRFRSLSGISAHAQPGNQMDGSAENLGSSNDQLANRAPQFGVNEEKTLLAFHVSRLLQIIKDVFGTKLAPNVCYQLNCSAIAIFRRFHLKNTPLDCDMGRSVRAAILLAAKTCEIELKQEFYLGFFEQFKITPEVFVKTELKLLLATRFELIVMDHTMVYSGLLLKLGIDEAQRDAILARLVEEDHAYFKTDLYLLLHPMVYALAKFGIWLENNHSEKKLESLWPQWDKATEITVRYARDKILSNQPDDEKQFDQARKKFDAFYKFVQQQASAARMNAGPQQERFKRYRL